MLDLDKLKADLNIATERRAVWIDGVATEAANYTADPSPSNKAELVFAAERLNWWCDQIDALTMLIAEAEEVTA